MSCGTSNINKVPLATEMPRLASHHGGSGGGSLHSRQFLQREERRRRLGRLFAGPCVLQGLVQIQIINEKPSNIDKFNDDCVKYTLVQYFPECLLIRSIIGVLKLYERLVNHLYLLLHLVIPLSYYKNLIYITPILSESTLLLS